MDELNGRSRGIQQFFTQPQAFSRRIHEQRPHPLAAIEYGITHGIVQALRRLGCRRQGSIERIGHTSRVVGDAILERCGHFVFRA